MDQLIPSLLVLVDGFRGCFRHEVFQTFQHILVGWIVCPGPRTLSEVWQATGRAANHHHDTAYSLFASAVWEWDELGKILVLLIVARLIPTGAIWIVVDDTLCHKRGAKVAFGGFFLDAVTSSKKKKNFRFGVNWVVIGLSVYLPFRKDRSFCLPVLWRAYRKKGTSAPSGLNFGVEAFQFLTSIVNLELPIDPSLLGVRFVGPDADLGLQNRKLSDPATPQALARQATQFALGHVQPTPVLRRVHESQPPHVGSRCLRIKCFVERSDRVRVQVVAHQPHPVAVRIPRVQ